MADEEGFLSRWSRLKREGEDAPPEPAAPEPPLPEPVAGEPEREPPSPLPPIDSLGADSDYTRFLAPDVPVELARLALRRAWVSDPAIANFRGFAEYDWDCNAPGYGALRATDTVADLLNAVFGDMPEEEVAAGDPPEKDSETSET
ncbi:DUF3306 domain-containing protein [Azospirillum sp.]|uniref:DUF3306 domain-containing protein n=1 Tax=Azospirillum sp. TaxID=34012 RepID=UPI003D71D009